MAFADEDVSVDDPLDDTGLVGSKLLISWGSERLQAVQYCTAEIGPFSMEVTIREGETPKRAYARAKAVLNRIAEEEFRTKIPEHVNRIKRAGNAARS